MAMLDGLLDQLRAYAMQREAGGGVAMPWGPGMPTRPPARSEDALLSEEFNAGVPASASGAGLLNLGGTPIRLPSSAGFVSPYDEGNPSDMAQQAAEAAALRTRNSVRRPGVFGKGAEPMAFGSFYSPDGLLDVSAPPPAAADLPPSTNDPQAAEPVAFKDGVPLPRPKPESGLNGQDGSGGAGPEASIPAAATPTGPAQAPGAPMSLSPTAIPPAAAAARAEAPAPVDAPGGGLSSLMNKILDPSKAPLFLALGAGFAGAPNIGQGISRASAAAVPAAASMRANDLKQTGIAASYRALISRGVPPNEALAAVYNPDIMKATAAKYFETKPSTAHKIGTDMMGNDIMGVFNPNANGGKGGYTDAAGNPIGADGGVGLPNAGAGILAKGVKDYDSSLPAEEYKQQFSPEVQAQMDAYIRGDTQPTGNPRMKGLATKIKEWATTYGSKAGIPVSDATFSERRKFLTELGSASAATAGGQVKAFNQGMEHADALAKKLEQLQNVDPVGVPAISHGLNWMRQAFSSKQTGIAKEAAGIGQTLAGEVGKLFSGTAGGGVHERELTRQRFNTITTPAELAGALEATVETMEGGLHALEARRDQTLTPAQAAQRPFVSKETQERIDRIRGTIKRLRGDEDAPAAASPSLKPGGSTVINGVTIKRLN